jgi:membrane protein implicated in regulation of membrane protease activity
MTGFLATEMPDIWRLFSAIGSWRFLASCILLLVAYLITWRMTKKPETPEEKVERLQAAVRKTLGELAEGKKGADDRLAVLQAELREMLARQKREGK